MTGISSTRPIRVAAAPALSLGLALAIGATVPARAEIYRCDRGETTVYSDVPCAEDAQVHSPGARLSVVSADRNLEAIAQRNAEFVEQRLERLERQRERAAERRREAERRARARQRAEPRTYPVFGHLGRHSTRDSFRRDRLDPRAAARARAARNGEAGDRTSRRSSSSGRSRSAGSRRQSGSIVPP